MAEALLQLSHAAENAGASPANTSAAEGLRRGLRRLQDVRDLARRLSLQCEHEEGLDEPEEEILVSRLAELGDAAAPAEDASDIDCGAAALPCSPEAARPLQSSPSSSPAWHVRKRTAHLPPSLPPLASLSQADSGPQRYEGGRLLDAQVDWFPGSGEAAGKQPSGLPEWLQGRLTIEEARKACSCAGTSCFERGLHQDQAEMQRLLEDAASLNTAHWFKRQEHQPGAEGISGAAEPRRPGGALPPGQRRRQGAGKAAEGQRRSWYPDEFELWAQILATESGLLHSSPGSLLGPGVQRKFGGFCAASFAKMLGTSLSYLYGCSERSGTSRLRDWGVIQSTTGTWAAWSLADDNDEVTCCAGRVGLGI
jgi:hypothetical protein